MAKEAKAPLHCTESPKPEACRPPPAGARPTAPLRIAGSTAATVEVKPEPEPEPEPAGEISAECPGYVARLAAKFGL